MKIIKTYEHIESLRATKSLSEAYLNHLESYFIQLHESLGGDNSLETFSLVHHGYLVILENGDDVRNLHDVGLNPKDGGLLGSWPEFVEEETLSDGTKLFKVAILYDNEYMMIFYSQAGQFDREVEEWLQEQCG